MKLSQDEKEIFDIIDAMSKENIEAELGNVDYNAPVDLPQDVLENIKKKTYNSIGIQRRSFFKKSIGLRIAAVLLVFAVIGVSYVGPGKVLAAIANKLSFIPGIGVVLDEKSKNSIYTLEAPIQKNIGKKYIRIETVINNNSNIKAAFSWNFINKPLGTITLVDSKGNSLIGHEIASQSVDQNGGSSSPSSNIIWVSQYEFKGKIKDVNNLKLVFKDNNNLTIGFSLKKPKIYKDYDFMGTPVLKNSTTITPVAKRDGNYLQVNFLTRSVKETPNVSDYLNLKYPGIVNFAYLEDLKGNEYSIDYKHIIDKSNKGDYNSLYFNLKEIKAKDYKLTVPYMLQYYQDETLDKIINFDIPAKGVLKINKEVKLAGFTVNIKRIERIKDNYVQLYVYTNFNSQKVESLVDFGIDYAENYGLSLKAQRSYFIGDAAYENLTDLKKDGETPFIRAFDKGGYTGYPTIRCLVIPIKPEMKTLMLKFFNPISLKQGPWEFNINLK